VKYKLVTSITILVKFLLPITIYLSTRYESEIFLKGLLWW